MFVSMKKIDQEIIRQLEGRRREVSEVDVIQPTCEEESIKYLGYEKYRRLNLKLSGLKHRFSEKGKKRLGQVS